MPTPCAAVALLVVIYADVSRTARELDWASIWSTKFVVAARSLRHRKTNFRSFIYSHSSTNPANVVKIGAVQIISLVLTKIVKNGT